MKVSDLDAYSSKYLSGKDLTDSIQNFTIVGVGLEELKKKEKIRLTLRETPKPWVVNKTQSVKLVNMLGDECSRWNGQVVGLTRALIPSGQYAGDYTIVVGPPFYPPTPQPAARQPQQPGPMPVHQAIPTAEQGSILTDDELPNFRGANNYDEEAFQ